MDIQHDIVPPDALAEAAWEALWQAIPYPLVAGRLFLALDDSINAKTGKTIFGCQRTFVHAGKPN